MRYFLELAYNGTRFQGYQKQPHGQTVQSTLEKGLSTLLRHPTSIVGCGRTDTGVHAKQYFAHFDTEHTISDNFIYALNALTGYDIEIYKVHQVADSAHARFDACSRSYKYFINTKADPFQQETVYYHPKSQHINRNKLQEAAQLLLEYDEFATFCKTNTDTKTQSCRLTHSEWTTDEERNQLVYHISANRFLRGMIRLIVGMCINVSRGKLPLEQVKKALEEQASLKLAWSVPPQGLFLTDIKYPYL